ncbi:hypothetical protein Glove_85g8 [Diversispora epigaea]|uniref:Uncharacterized protein n=1 Tax=Diversispora epigaea TaxID=1348612 RepID=A0A397JGH9_9GLOM|nr:hypothetical protein Glove_85g8 [Diversispora epigaea]
MSRIRNRSIFASAIARLPAFTAPSTSSTSKYTRPETKPTAPFVVEEEEEREATRKEIKSSMKRLIAKIDSLDKKMYTLLKEQIDIKKKFKNIELLSEINNDPNFSKLLEKLRGMRGRIASRVKSAIFEIFEESQLPRIDFQSSPTEINSWKSGQRVKDIYRKLFEEEEERSSKRRRTSGDRVLSPRLGSPRLGSPRLGSSRLGSPWLTSSRLVSPQLAFFQPVSPQPVSPQLFESPDTPDTTREEGDTTSGNFL